MASDLKLGYSTGYWAGGPPVGAPEAIAEAERLGFDSLWCAEAYGSDVLTPLAWWGASTSRIRLGTAIMQMSARTPAAAAMAAMTLDHLSGGRFVLGLGVSGPQVVEGWYGQPFGKPLARTREYIAIVRSILAREGPVTFERAADALRPMYALYFGGMGARNRNFHADVPRRMGYEDVVEKVQDAYLDGRKDEAAALIPTELIEKLALIGPADKVRHDAEAWRESIVTTLLVSGDASTISRVAEVLLG